MAVDREFEYIFWDLMTLALGPRGPGPRTLGSGPGPWAQDHGPRTVDLGLGPWAQSRRPGTMGLDYHKSTTVQ